jgi:hypothetical protein
MSTVTMPMPVSTSKSYVSRDGGDFDRRNFSIAGTPEAFAILSSGLYSNKVAAVIRELSTNAVDSHKMCGQIKPFEVHLPSYDEPWFSVKDYGVGMSHADVMDLYSTYFGTNKGGENLTTGCLGLGSKSPLAKVRSFTVISRHDGKERHYIVTLNEDRIPEVNYLPEQLKSIPSEDTGMEIKLAVATGDIYDYSREASRIYYYFEKKYRPRIVNGNSYVDKQVEVVLSGQDWRMIKGADASVAVQGNVGYPINSLNIKGLQNHHDSILQSKLEIDFPIGTLSFTPSREHLSYNHKTCTALLAKLDAISQEVNATVEKRFDACKTLWEARVLAWTLFWSSNAELKHLKQLANSKTLKYNGESVALSSIDFSDVEGVEAWEFAQKKKKSRFYGSSDDKTTISKNERSQFSPIDNCVWIESDMPRGNISRCQEYAREHNAVVYLVDFENVKAKVEFCERMGLDGTEFIPTSKLPKPVYSRSSNRRFGASSELVYKLKSGSSSVRHYDYWQATDVDMKNGGLYVPMKAYKVVDHKGDYVSPDTLTSLVRLLDAVVGKSHCVIGVRSKALKAFEKSDEWTNIYEYANHIVNTQLLKTPLHQAINDAKVYANWQEAPVWMPLVDDITKWACLRKSSVFYAQIDALHRMYKSYKQYANYYGKWFALADLLQINVKLNTTISPLDTVEVIYKKYPLVKVIANLSYQGYNSKISTQNIPAIIEYVRLIDANQ